MRNLAISHGPHLKTYSEALSLYAEGQIQKQGRDRQFHRIWDEHTLSLFVQNELCVWKKPSLYRKCVRIPCSCIWNQPMWRWLVVRNSFQCRPPDTAVPRARKQVQYTLLKPINCYFIICAVSKITCNNATEQRLMPFLKIVINIKLLRLSRMPIAASCQTARNVVWILKFASWHGLTAQM